MQEPGGSSLRRLVWHRTTDVELFPEAVRRLASCSHHLALPSHRYIEYTSGSRGALVTSPVTSARGGNQVTPRSPPTYTPRRQGCCPNRQRVRRGRLFWPSDWLTTRVLGRGLQPQRARVRDCTTSMSAPPASRLACLSLYNGSLLTKSLYVFIELFDPLFHLKSPQCVHRAREQRLHTRGIDVRVADASATWSWKPPIASNAQMQTDGRARQIR